MGKIKSKLRSRAQIVQALEDSQLAVEEYKLADIHDGESDIYQGWVEALTFVLGGNNARKYVKETKKKKTK